MANVRDRARTFIRDAATHRLCATHDELILATCQNGRVASVFGGLASLFKGSY
jgi:hypothetical protein